MTKEILRVDSLGHPPSGLKEDSGMTKRFVVFLLIATPAVAGGQTSGDLRSKYRQVTSYELRPGVVMNPKYAADGQVCEMVLEKRQTTDAGMVFGVSFSKKEVKELVDELVPEAERGRDLTRPLNTTVDGGFITTEYTYENVLVRVYGITRPEPGGDMIVTITWRKRACSQQVPPTAAGPRGNPAKTNARTTPKK
jgi:hypothetical protein